MEEKIISVIGAGLAGSEAAYQIAKRGIRVNLYEKRPIANTPAHHSDKFAELVCSNSLKSNSLDNASGLLKEEMRLLDSLIIRCADKSKVPAGQALAVDRELFSALVTEEIKKNKMINVINYDVEKLPEGIVVVATGPLTSQKLLDDLYKYLDGDSLYFYDAAAPLIDSNSINYNIAYKKSRYDKGGADYINCPFTKEQFDNFYNELINASTFPLHEFEKKIFFDACQPIEKIAKSGYKSLLFGPMKPVGLEKKDGDKPYAVVQLRQDDVIASIYNIVGFQTNLLQKEQKRVFSLIPGLENIEIIRYGMMHRNTYIDAPRNIRENLNLRKNENIYIAGQISGIEGYIESAASGILAAINAVRKINNLNQITMPLTTQLGSLISYITDENNSVFKPMNSNYGIMRYRMENKLDTANNALQDLKKWILENDEGKY